MPIGIKQFLSRLAIKPTAPRGLVTPLQGWLPQLPLPPLPPPPSLAGDLTASRGAANVWAPCRPGRRGSPSASRPALRSRCPSRSRRRRSGVWWWCTLTSTVRLRGLAAHAGSWLHGGPCRLLRLLGQYNAPPAVCCAAACCLASTHAAYLRLPQAGPALVSRATAEALGFRGTKAFVELGEGSDCVASLAVSR